MKSDGADIVLGSPKATQTQYRGQNTRIHTFKAVWTLNVIGPKSILCLCVCLFLVFFLVIIAFVCVYGAQCNLQG